MKPEVSAKNVLTHVLEVVPGEKLLLIYDDVLADVGEVMGDASLGLGLWTRSICLETRKIRKAIPSELREVLVIERPDIYINVLRGPSEETPFRISVTRLQKRRKVRLGHCPGISLSMLTDGAMALTGREYRDMQDFSRKLIRTVSSAERVLVTNPNGTNLTMSVKGRDFFADTYLDWRTMKWINLPVGEVVVGPVENSLEGTLISDGAIGGVGLIGAPVTIQISGGKASKPRTPERQVRKRVNAALSTDTWSSYVGELGIGVNPKARLSDEFLEIEKIMGTCHIAFGNNLDFPGGQNSSANHMDLLITQPTIEVQKPTRSITILKRGKFQPL